MNRYLYRLLRGMRKIVLCLQGKTFSSQLPCCEDAEKASSIIKSYVEGDNPCMVARFGATELLCMTNYLGIKANSGIWDFVLGRKTEWWWTDIVKTNMCRWSGFFPITPENLSRFCEMMFDDMKQLDVLGCWDQHETLFEDNLFGVKRVHLRLLEPFWSKEPWTLLLKNKRVLVVHPFADDIRKQYDRRHELFTSEILPDFSLYVIEAVQSLSGESHFASWFDALEWMKSEIDKIEYDICLIGCGAYGFPLAAHVKRQGKKAFHLGGALQLLFGIRGKRWENPNYGVKEWGIPKGSYSNLVNGSWVRPNAKEFINVENGCYW